MNALQFDPKRQDIMTLGHTARELLRTGNSPPNIVLRNRFAKRRRDRIGPRSLEHGALVVSSPKLFAKSH
jgi:hypothetical protein